MFEQLVESKNSSVPSRKPLSFSLAVVLHIVVLSILILGTPLFPDQLPGGLRALPGLVAPLPPPPGQPRVFKASSIRLKHSTANSSQLMAPNRVPSTIQQIVEPVYIGTDEEDIPSWNVPGGIGRDVPGFWKGIPGGDPRETHYLPPLAQAEARQVPPHPVHRVAVGGEIQMARLIHQTLPLYPPLARQARIQGRVVLAAIIAPDGEVEDLRVISGHPLLVPAALEAVKSWRYRPTLLNGQPASVETTITVNFFLIEH